MLLRYSPDYAITHLEEERLSVSKVSTFNDPFELHFSKGKTPSRNDIKRQLRSPNYIAQVRRRYPNLSDRQIKKLTKENRSEIVANLLAEQETIYEEQQKRLAEFMDTRGRVMCFVEPDVGSPFELPMWAYYSYKHTGMRIGLSDTFIQRKGFLLLKVSYSDTPPPYNFASHGNRPVVKSELFNIISTKSTGWRHEQEHRLIIPATDCYDEPDSKGELRSYVRLKPSDLMRIDLGARFDEKKVRQVLKLKSKYPDLEIFKAIQEPNAYGLQYEQIT